MRTPAASFVAYLWHYTVARLIYDELLRPIMRGGGGGVLIVIACICVAAGYNLIRVGRRRRKR
ncbi:MAG: hypothetical protein JOZ98_07690 [Solirubrobacterales bacterium]|nr:hypothetical protein [Solirubrobacterales bacterium]